MTVKELRDLLNKFIENGKENLNVRVSHYNIDAEDDVYYDINGAFENTVYNILELERLWEYNR